MQERTTAALVLLGLFLVPVYLATPSVLRFGAPATLSGALEAQGLDWALVMMDQPGTSSSIGQSGMSLQEITFYSAVEARAGTNSFGGEQQELTAQPQGLPPVFALESAGPASLYAEGRLNISMESVDAAIQIPPGHCLSWLILNEDVNFTTRSRELCPASWPAVLAHLKDESSIELNGTDVVRLQWHGMTASCTSERCPPGGDRKDFTTPLPPPNYLRTRRYSFEEATGGNASFRTTGSANLVVFGGTVMDLELRGWMRLPLASAPTSCEGCATPRDQTLFASGNLSLQGLSVDDGGQLKAHLDGEYADVRFDETAIDPSLLKPVLTGVAAVATTVAVAVLAKLALSALFTKRSEDDLLRMPRRRRLYEVVQQNPGIHVREALRQAELPSGAGRHHVTQLLRVGLLTQRRIGSNVRLFAGSAPAGDDWADGVAWADERFRPILDWVSANPGAKQKDILVALRNLSGWSITTTQHRLTRLVSQGVLLCTQDGRFRRYRLARPLANSAAPLPVVSSAAVQTLV